MNRRVADWSGLVATAALTLVLSHLTASPAPAVSELAGRPVSRSDCRGLPGAGVVPLSAVDRGGRGVAGVVVVLEDERLFQTDADGFVALPLEERGEVQAFGFERRWACVGPEDEGLLLEVDRACPVQMQVQSEEGGPVEDPRVDGLALTAMTLPCEPVHLRVTARGRSGRFVKVDPSAQATWTVTLPPGRELRVRGLDRASGAPLVGARLAGASLGWEVGFSEARLDRDGWGSLWLPAGPGVVVATVSDAAHESGQRVVLTAGPWSVSPSGRRSGWNAWSLPVERVRELAVRCYGLPDDRCPAGVETRCEAPGWSRPGTDAVACPAERDAVVRWGRRAVRVRPQDSAAWFDLRGTAEVRARWAGAGLPQLHRLGSALEVDLRQTASCEDGVCRWVGLEPGRWRMVPPGARRWEEGLDVDVAPGPAVVEAGILPVPGR